MRNDRGEGLDRSGDVAERDHKNPIDVADVTDADVIETSYGSPEEVRQMMFNAVGSDAIGREEYTDRDPETREEARRQGKNRFDSMAVELPERTADDH